MKIFKIGLLFFLLIVFSAKCYTAMADLEEYASPGASLGLADIQLVGESAYDCSGVSVASAGDVDGDGFSDILIGAYYFPVHGAGKGKTYLILGATIINMGGNIDLSCADYVFEGENFGDHSGCAVAGAGDVDGDGLDDILIGAAGNNLSAGATYLILGASLPGLGPNPISLSNADYIFCGENASDFSGMAVAGAGDVDGGGCSDFVIGAYRNNVSTGRTYLILGENLPGPGNISLSNADYIFVGENANDFSGLAVAGAGDVDGGGCSDILIGAHGNDDAGIDAGKTYLIFGEELSNLGNNPVNLSLAHYVFTGENTGDYSGCDVAGAGDVDGDGLSDILIGAYGNDNSTGKTYLVSGGKLLGLLSPVDLSLADYSFTGENGDDRSGCDVDGAGDVDGDGLSDILIGAYGNDDAASGAGKTYLIAGGSLHNLINPVDLSLADYSFTGENSDDYSGLAVTSAGDVDADRRSDILMGVYFYDEQNADKVGKTYLIFAVNAVYVDCDFGNDANPGTYKDPVETINEGIAKAAAGSFSRVIVRGGVYNEVVNLEPDIELIGELRNGMPPKICRDGNCEYIVIGAQGASLKYFVIKNGGIRLYGVEEMTIEENIILNKNSNAVSLWLYSWSNSNVIKNNIIYKESGNCGAFIAVRIDSNCSNNVFINNTIHVHDEDGALPNNAIGVYFNAFNGGILDNEFRNNIIQCDVYPGGGGIPYGFYICGYNTVNAAIEYNRIPSNNDGIALGTGNLVGGSGFADFVSPMPNGFDYHLNPASPCIDAGDPDPSYNDPDGTQNDMGAYGGPGYLDFM